MNLPHLPPIRFAQYIITKQEEDVQVMCQFPKQPTLGMYIEAAAQSSAAFQSQSGAKMGFVISIKEAEILNYSNVLQCKIDIKKQTQLGFIFEFFFCVYDKELPLAQGTITLLISED